MKPRTTTHAGWPRRFPLVQAPNALLWVVFGAGVAGRGLRGRPAEHASALYYVAAGMWAHDEMLRGANWFRRLLGVACLLGTVGRVARRFEDGSRGTAPT